MTVVDAVGDRASRARHLPPLPLANGHVIISCPKHLSAKYFQMAAPSPRSVTTVDPAENILRALRRIIRAVDLSSRRLASEHGLTGPQLVCIREIQRSGPMSAGGLARAVALSPPTVTGILDRLERAGLVRRDRREDDKRQVTVSLTDEGADMVQRTPLPLHEQFLEQLNGLDPEELEAIEDVLDQVVRMLEADQIDAAPLLAIGPTDADPEVIRDYVDAASRGEED